MIKRKDGRWFLSDKDGKSINGETFATLDEARIAETKIPPVVAKPVQTLNTSSGSKSRSR
jgi:hypothetical protein